MTDFFPSSCEISIQHLNNRKHLSSNNPNKGHKTLNLSVDSPQKPDKASHIPFANNLDREKVGASMTDLGNITDNELEISCQQNILTHRILSKL